MKSQYLQQCPQILREFLGYMETVKGRSQTTVNEYFLDLRTFFRFLKISRGLTDKSLDFNLIEINDIDIAVLKTVTLADAYEFLNYVTSERGNSARSRARKSTALRVFFTYLTDKTGKLEVNPLSQLDTPKTRKSLPKYLTLEQSMELLTSTDGKYKERNFCILTLFLNCGLRLSELVMLNLGDIRDDNTMRVLGKGNKERIVYINDACKLAIDNYLKVRPTEGIIDKNALFISRDHRRISRRMVQVIVENALNKIGLGGGDGFSVHKLRHTAATLMYQYGEVDIRVLKEILGHESLATTEIYTHLSSTQMEDAANSNPLSKMKPRRKP